MTERPFYLITDCGRLRQSDKLLPTLLDVIEVIGDNIFAVQIREQVVGHGAASDPEVLDLISRLRDICLDRGVKLLVNANLQLAREVDGVHLGKFSCGVEEARESLGARAIIGYSAHEVSELAELGPVDFVTFSPIFRPLSKKSTIVPHGVPGLKAALETSRYPIYALGGVTRESLKELRMLGVAGVAMISAILLSSEPRNAALNCRKAWFG